MTGLCPIFSVDRNLSLFLSLYLPLSQTHTSEFFIDNMVLEGKCLSYFTLQIPEEPGP